MEQNITNAFAAYQKDNDTEQLIRSLKDLGLSQVQSIKALMEHVKLPLKEADALVLHSKAWAGSYEGTVQLRDDIFDALQELE